MGKSFLVMPFESPGLREAKLAVGVDPKLHVLSRMFSLSIGEGNDCSAPQSSSTLRDRTE